MTHPPRGIRRAFIWRWQQSNVFFWMKTLHMKSISPMLSGWNRPTLSAPNFSQFSAIRMVRRHAKSILYSMRTRLGFRSINGLKNKRKIKLKTLLARDVINSATRFVLANAIYFKGNWADQFDESETQPKNFTLLDGSSAEVPFMSQRSLRTHYAELRPDGTPNSATLNEDTLLFDSPPNPDGFQILELEYRGRDLAMTILLPKKHTGLPVLGRILTTDKLTQWLDTVERREVHVFLPKFKLEENMSLKQTLSAMGMPKAFEPNGFLGMSDAADAWKLYISHIAHKAYVDVNEEGTEAAAATMVVGRARSAVIKPPIPTFRADRPFLFLIRDKRTGTILFLGRLMRPPQ